MLLLVAALVAATFASGAWCAGEILRPRARAWLRAGRPIATSAVLLPLVLGVAVGLRFFFIPPHHAMYVDEPWYAEAACSLGRFGRLVLCEETWSGTACQPYGKAWGWPIVLSPWTMLFGCDTVVGIQVNRVLGSATVLLVAVATRCAGARWWQGVMAAAVLAILPVHVAWSATGETNVAAAAMLLAGLCGGLVYVRTGRSCGAALAVSGLGLATAVRPESFVPALVAAAVLALVTRARVRQRLFVAGAIGMVAAAAATSALQLWAMNESISGGAFLSWGNILRSARQVVHSDSLPIHGGVVLLALSGALVAARSPHRPAAYMLLSTGLAAALAALAYDRFHERMLLGATVTLLPLGGFIFDWLPQIVTVGGRRFMLRPLVGTTFLPLLGLLWRHALISASVPPETQLLETRVASQVGRVSLEENALFITEQPTVLRAAGISHVMATERALLDEPRLTRELIAGRPIYFLRDMYCESGFQGVATPSLCDRMLAHFAMSPMLEAQLNTRTYTLFRVSVPTGGDATQ